MTAPEFDYWGGTGAQALVQGFVRANGDGKLTVGCYLYDVLAQTELARQGFVVPPADWRRAAHKCADMVYSRLTGEGAYFDSRVVYVSETGPKDQPHQAPRDHGPGRRQSPLPDQRPVDRADAALRAEPAVDRLHELRRTIGRAIYVYDLGSGRQRLRGRRRPTSTFAPRFSPDGRYILFSMAVGGNTDIYRVSSHGGTPQRLTTSPGIDTGGSYSPDGIADRVRERPLGRRSSST